MSHIQRPTVAVTIPVFNGARFIDQALASLVTQTAPVDEVIVVDDMSEDDSVARAERWSSVLPIRVFKNTKRSWSWRSRDVAIQHATAELIFQLDADDILLPQHVALMLEAYDRSPGLVTPRRMLLLESSVDRVPILFDERTPTKNEQLIQLLLLNYVGIGSLFSKSDYLRIGGYHDYRISGDWDLWLRMAAAGLTISRPERRTYLYRMHSSNLSSSVDRRVTDIPILEKFLANCEDATLRRTARLSMMQRMGLRFFVGFDSQGESGAEFWDPDIGLIRIGDLTSDSERSLIIFEGKGDGDVVLKGHFNSGMEFKILEIGPALQEVSCWPDYKYHFTTG